MISIIDYGVGNLGSVQNMLKKINVKSEIISNETEIIKADKIILPGVGNFGKAIKKLNALKGALTQRVIEDKVPILGICLGMQLLTNGSEESPETPGLGFIPGFTYKFIKNGPAMRIPHMGWNYTRSKSSPLIDASSNENKYYFVHSFYVKTENPDHTIIECKYGHVFAAGIRKENIYGTQFHPEKSHKFGMKIFQNFSKI